MWRIRVSVAAAIWGAAALATVPMSVAEAGDTRFTAVVELFTSQGCSSCPPADALLETYVKRPDVLALTFPVDYWDYLGWKDTFASPRYSERQRAYAAKRGDGSVYTPQVVINGRAHAVGSRKKEIDKTIIAMSTLAPLSVPVTTRSADNMVLIEFGEQQDARELSNVTVWVAIIQRAGEVSIHRGENGGRSLKYYNIVRELAPVGMWSGKAETIRLDPASVGMKKADACAILVQEGHGGPIIGAAWIDW